MTKATFARFASFCLVGLLIAGCGDDDDDDQIFTSSLTGSYIGDVQDSIAGAGTLVINLTQNGSAVSGTFEETYPANPNFDNEGTISNGVVSGNRVTYLMNSVGLQCDFDAVATRVSENRLQGEFEVTADCPDEGNATFDISR